jgi:hypothetical protein
VVLEGSIEIIGHSLGTPHTVTVHRAGGFTGDVDMLSGRGVFSLSLHRRRSQHHLAPRLRRAGSERVRVDRERAPANHP